MNRKIVILSSLAIAGATASGLGLYALTQNRPGDLKNAQTAPLGQAANQNSAEFKQFSRLRGQNYDRAFLAGMIAHHQGATDMASLALAQAGHSQIKELARSIISTQSREIASMKNWQKTWGYNEDKSPASHSTMNMGGSMEDMTAELKGLSGDGFDKKFLDLMIKHHQSAIDMATPGQTRAGTSEVKDLTRAIVEAQSREIAQMKQWQKTWGYQ